MKQPDVCITDPDGPQRFTDEQGSALWAIIEADLAKDSEREKRFWAAGEMSKAVAKKDAA